MRIKQPSAKHRITGLKNLIQDGVQLDFATPLILGYNQQLITLQEEVAKDKEKQRRFKNEN